MWWEFFKYSCNWVRKAVSPVTFAVNCLGGISHRFWLQFSVQFCSRLPLFQNTVSGCFHFYLESFHWKPLTLRLPLWSLTTTKNKTCISCDRRGFERWFIAHFVAHRIRFQNINKTVQETNWPILSDWAKLSRWIQQPNNEVWQKT